MRITQDSQVILLLCSYLGIYAGSEIKPLNLREWNSLARHLQSISMRPSDLLGLCITEIQEKLSLNEEQAHRYSGLLARSGILAIELERLNSLGIQVLTRADDDYPTKYRERLKESAPSVLFFAGEKALLGQPGIAVVGSRNLDKTGIEAADFIGNACGLSGLVLYSGGARGVDTISMQAALKNRGTAVGVIADSLEKAIRVPENRTAIQRGDLCLVTPYSTNAPFSVGNAMGRNRLIYTLADYALIVASDVGKGGTWAGAMEAIKAKWIPVFVLEHESMPDGNKHLMEKGCLAFLYPSSINPADLQMWLKEKTDITISDAKQLSLF